MAKLTEEQMAEVIADAKVRLDDRQQRLNKAEGQVERLRAELDNYRADAACENPARYLTREQARTEIADRLRKLIEEVNEDCGSCEEAEEAIQRAAREIGGRWRP